jgi:hypothetical protein
MTKSFAAAIGGGHPSARRATGLAILVALLAPSLRADAECLGLEIPAPKDLNVCRQLVEDLVVPPVVSFKPNCNISGFECLALPHCCLPGACLAFPECVVTDKVIEAAGYIAHAGDVYCGVQEISAEHLVDDIVNNRLPDPVQLATGGADSVLYTHAGAYLDTLECGASELPPNFADAIRIVMGLSGFNGAFTDADLSRVRILPKRDSGVLNLPKDGYNAITLDSLVFLQDELYDAIMNWQSDTWIDLLAGRLKHEDPQGKALETMTHELVHVRQYRELGREAFLNNYFVDAAANGYEQDAFEQEAYAVAGRDWSWLWPAFDNMFAGL